GLTRVLGSLKAKEQPLPLESVQLRARVVDRVAEVTVEQKFGNPFREAIEAVYVFPLAGGSAVSRFEMQIGKRVVRGRIEERAEARRQYAQALDQGKRAALLEQERDDVFTVQVGNVTPGDAVVVRLSDLACSQHAVSTSSGPESARVMLSREREPLDRDFVLRWRIAGEQVKSQLLAHGGFALLSVVPPARQGFLGVARDVVFVLDRS